jgi:hypothetical protein
MSLCRLFDGRKLANKVNGHPKEVGRRSHTQNKYFIIFIHYLPSLSAENFVDLVVKVGWLNVSPNVWIIVILGKEWKCELKEFPSHTTGPSDSALL